MSSEVDRERRRRIREKIRKLREDLKRYKEYKEDFEDGKKKFEKAYNGVQHLKGAQYNKVTSTCEEAIGNEEYLLESLQIKHTDIDQVIGDIISEVNRGTCSIQDKIDIINEQIFTLEAQL